MLGNSFQIHKENATLHLYDSVKPNIICDHQSIIHINHFILVFVVQKK